MKTNKFHLSLFILGFTSIIAQILILREFLASFFGNEFFICLTLAFWLWWTSLGSYLAQKFKEKISNLVACSHLLVAILLPCLILVLRLIKGTSAVSGALPNFLPSIFLAFFLMALPCSILGAIYTLSAKKLLDVGQKNKSEEISTAYFIETAGFILGGFIFSFGLIFLDEILIILILSLINLLISFIINYPLVILKAKPEESPTYVGNSPISHARGILRHLDKSGLLRMTVNLIFIIIVIAAFPFYQKINLASQNLKFKHQKIIQTLNTAFGQTTITQTNGQYNFYQNSKFLSADQNIISSEIIAHLPLLAHPQPKNILFIGNGYSGVIREILKHSPEKIYYLEQDKKFLNAVKSYLPAELLLSLENERVKIIHQDAQSFLPKIDQKFDAIILNLPDPTNLNINKYYSIEFFKLCQEHLSEKGILSLHISTLANYLSPAVKNYNAYIYQTLKSIFSQTYILPIEDELYFYALPLGLNFSSHKLVEDLNQRQIQTNFITPAFMNYKLNDERINQFKQQLENTPWITNQNLRPTAYHAFYLFWLEHFSSPLSQAAGQILQPRPVLYVLCLFMALILLLFLSTPQHLAERGRLIFTIAVAGFTLMSLEIILLLNFQIAFGNLYYHLSLLITLLMFGLLIGTWLAKKMLTKFEIKKQHLILVHCLLAIYIITIILITNYQLLITNPLFLVNCFLFLVIGFLVGLDYPFINHLYFKLGKIKTGTIYAADLFGACWGALLPAVVLIPTLGLLPTLIIILFLNLFVIIYLTLFK